MDHVKLVIHLQGRKEGGIYMKFIVDRIEENIVVCENIDTKEIIQISINEIPENIKEGNVIFIPEDCMDFMGKGLSKII